MMNKGKDYLRDWAVFRCKRRGGLCDVFGHPSVNIFCCAGEVHAYADHCFAFEPVGLVVFFVFDLLESNLWAFVEFEFQDIDVCVGFDETVHTTVAGADFAVDADAHVGKEQVYGCVEEFFGVFFVE